MGIVYLDKTLSGTGEFFGIHQGTQIHVYQEDGIWVAQFGGKKVFGVDKEGVIQKAIQRIENPQF